MMGSAGCSQSNVGNPIQNFELQIQQNDPELGVRQDNRSCATKAFKWIVRHPFLTAAATIGLVGIASGGIFGLTLLGAAAPVATALSGLNASTEAPTTKASTFIARSVTCEKIAELIRYVVMTQEQDQFGRAGQTEDIEKAEFVGLATFIHQKKVPIILHILLMMYITLIQWINFVNPRGGVKLFIKLRRLSENSLI